MATGRTRLICAPSSIGVAVAGDKECKMGQTLGTVMTFLHPGIDIPAQFLLTPNGDLMELQSIMPSGTGYGSWFVEHQVVSDGRLYVASVFDPKFLLLPVLEKHGSRFSPLEQILAAAGEAGSALLQLRSSRRLELHRICQVNDQLGDDMILYRLDADKTLIWLVQKVRRAQAKLRALEAAKEQSGLGSAYASGFMVSSAPLRSSEPPAAPNCAMEAAVTPCLPVDDSSKEHLRVAVELVCEYLSDEWSNKLMTHLGVTEAELKAATSKRSPWEQSEEDKAMELMHGKRAKVVDSGAAPGLVAPSMGAPRAPAPQTAAQKRLAKTSTKGMRSIGSFFGGKGR